MQISIACWYLVIFEISSTFEEVFDSDESIMEDALLDFPDSVLKHGYPVEIHKVLTYDDYILTLHRIPFGRKCDLKKPRKPPVLVMHGLLCNSFCWIATGPEKSLAYILADECYDVWLGNSRGNSESKEHRTLSTYSSAYWDFSWHEMGALDLPAVIQYILGVTKKTNLHYIGHSQGTTQFFVFNSLYPQFSSKIRSFQALAPVAFVTHIRTPLARIASPFSRILEGFAKITGIREFLPSNELLSALGSQICRDRYPASQLLCSNVLFLLFGYDSEQLNTTVLPVVLGHLPAGASTKQLIHYSQNIQSGSFKQYDYTPLINLLKYGIFQPPAYNLSNVLVPVALHYSLNDWFVDVRDLDRLASKLPNVIGKFLVPLKKFNHLDFMWAIDAKSLLYERVLQLMDQY